MAKRFFNICLTLSAMMFMMSSCITTKQVAYLQDMKHDTQIQLENKFEAVISPYDEISILVSCSDAELAKPFNLNMSAPSEPLVIMQRLSTAVLLASVRMIGYITAAVLLI